MAHLGMTDDWAGRRVLITGHTGFKGAWLGAWLGRRGADVAGLSLDDAPVGGANRALWPAGARQHFVDICDEDATLGAVREEAPDVVFHLAAQALVRRGYERPLDTYRINVLGTGHVLSAVTSTASVRATVVVTSDKVYANNGSGKAFTEDDPLGGHDPYSTSKACAELLTASWLAASPDLPIATARAGNVIGGGDRGADRLLVDLEAALLTDAPVTIRNPTATRPWQFVLDPLAGYVRLAEELFNRPDTTPRALNFGPDRARNPDVRSVVDQVIAEWGSGHWDSAADSGPPEAMALALDSSLAASSLGWQARVPLEIGLRWTVAWWRAAASAQSLSELATSQMAEFEEMRP